MCVEATAGFWGELFKNAVTSADARAKDSRLQPVGDEFN